MATGHEWFADPHRRRSDLAEIRRALRRGWSIPGEMRADLVDKLRALLAEPDLRPREQAGAVELLEALERASA